MSDPGDLETYEEERVDASELVDHVFCPNCAHQGTYLCGSSREDQCGPALPLSDSFIGTPCAVCFSSPTLTCNRCGTEIMTCL